MEKDTVGSVTTPGLACDNKEPSSETQTTDGEDDGSSNDKPTGVTFMWMTIALMLAVFIMALDTTILCKLVVT